MENDDGEMNDLHDGERKEGRKDMPVELDDGGKK